MVGGGRLPRVQPPRRIPDSSCGLEGRVRHCTVPYAGLVLRILIYIAVSLSLVGISGGEGVAGTRLQSTNAEKTK